MANSKAILLSRAMIKVNNTNKEVTSNTHLKVKASLHLADKTRSDLLNRAASSTANNHISSAPMMLATHKVNQATTASSNHSSNNMAATTPTLKIRLTNSNSVRAVKANKAKAYLRTTNLLASPLIPTPPTTTQMLLL